MPQTAKNVRVTNVATTDQAAREAIAALESELSGQTITELREAALTACYAHVIAVLALKSTAFGKIDKRTKYPFTGKLKELFGVARRCRSDITTFSAVMTVAHSSKISVDQFRDWLRESGGTDPIYRKHLASQRDPVNDNEREAETAALFDAVPTRATTEQEYPDGTYIAVIRADGGSLDILRMIPREERKITTLLRRL